MIAGIPMKKTTSLLLCLITVFLVACGGGGSSTETPAPTPAPTPTPITPTKMTELKPASTMTWATSAANVVTVKVVDVGNVATPGVTVSLFSVQKIDPIDGSTLSQDMWIRKGLLATGVTDASGRFSATVQLATSAEHVIAVAELSTFTAGSPPVTSVRTASGALALGTVGTVGTLTLSSPNS
jgi:hypothetical protein